MNNAMDGDIKMFRAYPKEREHARMPFSAQMLSFEI